MFVSPSMQKLCHSSDEWFFSKGSLGITAHQDVKGHWYVNLFPSLREIVGGKRDGKKVYSKFFIEIGNLRRVFDRPPSIQYDSGVKGLPPFIYVRGRIDGELFVICIMSKPPAGTQPAEQVFVEGRDKGRINFMLPHIDEAT